MKLILVPLMKSDKDKHEVIEGTIELAKLIDDDYEQCAVIAGILTATDKIIKEDYGIKIREWLKMTKVEKIIEKEKEELVIEEVKKLKKQLWDVKRYLISYKLRKELL